MDVTLTHEIELYPWATFQTLLDHEVLRAKRYQQPLCLIQLAVEPEPLDLQTQFSAELFTINALNLEVRETDIPCKRGSEFYVLLPATPEAGGRVVCERLAQTFRMPHQKYDRVSFEMSTLIALTCMTGAERILGNQLLQQAATALQAARQRPADAVVVFSDLS